MSMARLTQNTSLDKTSKAVAQSPSSEEEEDRYETLSTINFLLLLIRSHMATAIREHLPWIGEKPFIV